MSCVIVECGTHTVWQRYILTMSGEPEITEREILDEPVGSHPFPELGRPWEQHFKYLGVCLQSMQGDDPVSSKPMCKYV